MATSGIADIRTARDGSLQLPGGFGDYLLQNSFLRIKPFQKAGVGECPINHRFWYRSKELALIEGKVALLHDRKLRIGQQRKITSKIRQDGFKGVNPCTLIPCSPALLNGLRVLQDTPLPLLRPCLSSSVGLLRAQYLGSVTPGSWS